MAQWRIKEISDLTNVSVRTLHHYDKIGLLKPSVRASNGYRGYSEQDLAALQQIIALKFFGFGLGQIKTMLQQKPSILEHLLVQEQIVKEQTEHLRQTQDALAVVVQRCHALEILDWNDLIALIERYRMAGELKKTWAGKLYNKDQQTRYIAFKQAYPKEAIALDKTIESIKSKLLGDPEGPDGQRAVKAFLEHSKAVVAWETTTKKTSKKVTQEDATEVLEFIDKMKTEGMLTLSTEGMMWLSKAMITYQLKSWDRLHKDITKNLDADPDSAIGKKIASQWRELVSENCPGGSIEFFFGTNLLMQAAKAKADIQDYAVPTPEQMEKLAQHAKMMEQDAKLLRDPMALSWIEKALKAR